MRKSAGCALFLLLPGVAIGAWSLAAASDGPRLLVRLQSTGGGMVLYYRTFELYADGALEMARTSAAGKVMERRRQRLSPEATVHYQEVLQRGGYEEKAGSVLSSSVVRDILAESEDLPSWRIEVGSAESRRTTAFVPSLSVERYHPELREIPYVAAAWQLLRDFSDDWERAEKTFSSTSG